MKKIDVRDLTAGALLAALGVFVSLYTAAHYPIGQASRMGPGYFPFALGWILAGLGAIVMLSSVRKVVQAAAPMPLHARALFSVLLAILAFSLLIDRAGLVLATVALTLFAALADRPFRLRRTLLLAGSLALLSWLIFTLGLQMNLPAFAFME